jgi:thiamine kinase-like enzyme
LITLGRIQDATSTAAVTAFVEEQVLAGSEWQLAGARRRWVRLDPPYAYWALYAIRLGRGEQNQPDLHEQGAEPGRDLDPGWSEERELRLVARGVFDEGYWPDYRESLVEKFGGRPCDPLRRRGYPVIFDETQHVFWFYPVDPLLRTLPEASDAARLRRLFRNVKQEVLDRPARVSDVHVDLVRYLPENNAILRYELVTQPASAGKTVYGKVHRSNRVAETNRVMEHLWRLSRRSEGMLNIPKPLGFYPELGLFLQDAVPGRALGGDRTDPSFMKGAIAAADAIAIIHASDVPTENEITIEQSVNRLDELMDQFALVHPQAHFLLRELAVHVRSRLSKTRPEEHVPSHGDYKHDQLLHEDGHFTLIDFDFFGRAETSHDLAEFCSHLTPAKVPSWEYSIASEEARKAFLDRYRELRPNATLQRFPIYEALDLASRAMVLMWSQSRDWRKSAEFLLVLAMERLNSRLP